MYVENDHHCRKPDDRGIDCRRILFFFRIHRLQNQKAFQPTCGAQDDSSQLTNRVMTINPKYFDDLALLGRHGTEENWIQDGESK